MVGCRQTVVDSLVILDASWPYSLDLWYLYGRKIASYTGENPHEIILPEIIAIAGGLYDTLPTQEFPFRIIAYHGETTLNKGI